MKLGPYELDQIYTGDARELAKTIPDESVDLIFTDPVYDRIDDYKWLAEMAARVLRKDGSLMAFSIPCYFDRAIPALSEAIQWRGILSWYMAGVGHKRYGKTIDNGLYILWAGGWPHNYTPLAWISLFEKLDNPFHWGKGASLTMRHIDDWTLQDAIILDPFTGGGTVPAVCKMLGRHYLAFEIDPDTAERARQRVEMTQPPLLIPQPEQAELF